jgi:HlyD family secretion protein
MESGDGVFTMKWIATAVATAVATASVALCLAGCAKPASQPLGTLEWDRIGLPAPVSERIAEIPVHEGQRVAAGDILLVLEPERTRARLDAAQADALRQRHALDELRIGPRREDIDRARAQLAGAQSVARNAHRELERVQPLVARQFLARSQLDTAREQVDSADANVAAANAALAALVHGSRPEDIAQAEAALAAAQAQVAELSVNLERTQIRAPRAGRIDSIPYKLGDQPPIGATLAIELVGAAPYARVYVPEPQRANVRVGQAARVYVDGRSQPFPGHVRMVRSEPSFTPYYALSGDDAARLSYLAEVALDSTANDTDLPAGLPVHVEFAASK